VSKIVDYLDNDCKRGFRKGRRNSLASSSVLNSLSQSRRAMYAVLARATSMREAGIKRVSNGTPFAAAELLPTT